MDFFAMPVTLVVKAPNERIGDHTVECGLDWTIQKLKQHLATAYPSKPQIHQQRLIYSGKLLQDQDILKDVLRHTYGEDQTRHTVHLVCCGTMTDSTPKKCDTEPKIPAEENVGLPHINNVGLRHRNVAPIVPQQIAGLYPTPEQMMWYQQMYAYQMNQYMQYYQQYQQLPQLAVAEQQPDEPARPQPGQQMVVNAAGGQVEDEEEMNRDWLDWTYVLCRASMLLAIVYFYSTLGRFFMVFGFFFLIYMYQAGWFRLRRRVVRNEEAQPEEAVEEVQQAPGVLRVTLSFFVTFFTSLIPHQPAPVNAN